MNYTKYIEYSTLSIRFIHNMYITVKILIYIRYNDKQMLKLKYLSQYVYTNTLTLLWIAVMHIFNVLCYLNICMHI